MTERSNPKTTHCQPSVPLLDTLSSLLVPIDLSANADRVAGRAALLPLAQGAELTLLHVIPKGLSPAPMRKAKMLARDALDSTAKRLERTLPKDVRIQRLLAVGSPAVEIAQHADATGVELILMGRGGGRALRDVFLGSTAERTIRRGRLPVLVVRQPPDARYRRSALALTLDQGAHYVVAWLLRLIPPPRGQVEVIHAFDVPFEGLTDLTSDDAEDNRKRHGERVERELARALSSALTMAGVPPACAPSWRSHVRHGDLKTVVVKTVEKTNPDLLALGANCYSGIAHAFFGMTAGEVLREVSCDVLVVPPNQSGFPSS